LVFSASDSFSIVTIAFIWNTACVWWWSAGAAAAAGAGSSASTALREARRAAAQRRTDSPMLHDVSVGSLAAMRSMPFVGVVLFPTSSPSALAHGTPAVRLRPRPGLAAAAPPPPPPDDSSPGIFFVYMKFACPPGHFSPSNFALHFLHQLVLIVAAASEGFSGPSGCKNPWRGESCSKFSARGLELPLFNRWLESD